MKFTMRMPFAVVPGAAESSGCLGSFYYTATVVDKDGRTVGLRDERGRSLLSQADANRIAMRNAQEWAKRVREHAGV